MTKIKKLLEKKYLTMDEMLELIRCDKITNKQMNINGSIHWMDYEGKTYKLIEKEG